MHLQELKEDWGCPVVQGVKHESVGAAPTGVRVRAEGGRGYRVQEAEIPLDCFIFKNFDAWKFITQHLVTSNIKAFVWQTSCIKVLKCKLFFYKSGVAPGGAIGRGGSGKPI